MDLTARLREAIADLHVRIERLPLSAALIGGRVPRLDYLRLLGQLFWVHAKLESELPAHAATRDFFRPTMARAEVILNDLRALGRAGTGPRLPPTQTLVTDLDCCARHAPVSLLGALYVLEGSRMGSMMLVKPLAEALHQPAAPGHGLDYHLDGMAERPRTWQGFKAALSAVPLTEQDQHQVVNAAVLTMAGLYEIYAAVGAAGAVPAVAAPLPQLQGAVA